MSKKLSSIRLSVSLLIHPSIHPSIIHPSSIRLFIHPFFLPSFTHYSLIYPPIHSIAIHPSSLLSLHGSTQLPTHGCGHPSDCPFNHPANHLSVHPPTHPPMHSTFIPLLSIFCPTTSIKDMLWGKPWCCSPQKTDPPRSLLLVKQTVISYPKYCVLTV